MKYALKTTNKSFVNMWRHLQKYKIENNLFMLQVLDDGLVDFSIEKYMSMDRDDPTFQIYRNRVIEEARNNIWFYFRELVMVPDEESLSGYKHFELSPATMLMIYLYDKKASFITANGHHDICLKLLWNLHKSKTNTDLVLVNDFSKMEMIETDMKKCIANMRCHIPFGSSQILSDNIEHRLSCNTTSIKNLYLQNSRIYFKDIIDSIYKKYMQGNSWVTGLNSIFILENDMPLITYSYVLDLVNHGYRLYLSGISIDNIDRLALNNFLNMYIPYADTSIYDINERDMKSLYVI